MICRIDDKIDWMYVRGGFVPAKPYTNITKPIVEYYKDYNRVLKKDHDEEEKAIHIEDIENINIADREKSGANEIEGLGGKVVRVKFLENRLRLFEEPNKEPEYILTYLVKSMGEAELMTTMEDFKTFQKGRFIYLIIPEGERIGEIVENNTLLPFIGEGEHKSKRLRMLYPKSKTYKSLQEAKEIFGREKVIATLL